MSKSWDELGDKADNEQPSGGEIRYLTVYPFQKMFMTVAGCGVIVIEELLEEKPTPFAQKSVRLGMWKNEDIIPKKSSADEMFRYYKDSGPFPDEDK